MSPYYAAPDRPAGVIWAPAGLCRICTELVPAASRRGVAHPLGEHLCLDHLLVALGVPSEPTPAPPAPHNDGAIRAAFRAGLKVPSSVPAGGPLPGRQAPVEPLPAELLEAALTTMRGLGAVPLRNEPTYGVPCGWGCAWRPPTPKTVREYDAGQAAAWDDEVTTGAPGVPVDLDDPAVPSGARTLARAATKGGWAPRVMAGPSTVILQAERAGVGLLLRYERGRFASGWLRAHGAAVACTASQVATILRAG